MRKDYFKSLIIAAALVCAAPSYAQVTNGKATTAAPTYTNNSVSPLSLQTDGALRVSGETSITGNVTVDQGTSPWVTSGAVTSLPSIPAGTNNIGDVDVLTLPAITGTVTANQGGTWNIATVTAVTGITNALPAGTNNIGDIDVLTLPAIPAGNNNIGDVDAIQSGTWNIGTVTTVTGATVIPATNTAGTSNFSLISLASTNTNAIKASAGTVYEISMYNNSASLGYLKLYNATSATCGSGTPVARYLIPASTSGAGSNVVIPLGKTFATGISMCLTGAIADADTTSVAANAFLINITYK